MVRSKLCNLTEHFPARNIVYTLNFTVYYCIRRWSIIESRYVDAYTDRDNQTNLRQQYRRFRCFPTSPCHSIPIWIDDNYCVLFESTDVGHLRNYYPIDIGDEVQVWAGNLLVEPVSMDMFRSGIIDEHGWIQEQGLKNGFNSYKVEYDPVHVVGDDGQPQVVFLSDRMI